MKQTDITYAQACKLNERRTSDICPANLRFLPANAESDRTC